MTPGSPEWPTQLDHLPDPPTGLYGWGLPVRRALHRSIAIVGSRAASPTGVALTRAWAAEFARHGYAVVSGGAFGIDAAAHEGALRAGGHTVAVLAAGVDVDSPRGNRELLAAIRARGTVVSELPPGTTPAASRFLTRNRLIAAMAPATLVVQAAARSGAMHTAVRAAEIHRVVMAVPGAPTDPAHEGCNRLIRDHVAVLVSNPQEVVELLPD